MNFKWDKKYLYWGMTAFFVIAASAVFFLSLSNIAALQSFFGTIIRIITPIIYGFVLAYLLSPIMNFFEKKVFRVFFRKIVSVRLKSKIKKDSTYVETQEAIQKRSYYIKKTSRGLGVAFTMLTMVLALFGLISAVLPQLISTFQTMGNNLNEYYRTVNSWLLSLLADYPDVYKTVSTMLTSFTDSLKTSITDFVLPQMTSILTNVSSGIMLTISTFFNLILGFIICIYFLNSKALFAAQGKKVLYGITSKSVANVILKNLRHIHKTFGGFITGKLIDSLIIGIIFFIILTIFNMPYTLLISIFLGVTNIIPYFGPFIGAIPSALLILLIDPLQCLYFIIIVLVVQQFDGNILGPKILGDNTGLSSFWVIFAILVGKEIFGFIGLVIGVPLFSVIYYLTKNYISKRLKKKGLPVDSNEYREIAYLDSETGDRITLHELKEEERLRQAEKRAQQQKKPSTIAKIITKKKDK